MIGSTVQKYRIVRELGSGAMGAVYEAVDTLTERPVAMKVLRAELARQPELIERFRSEAVTLGRLNHSNIALLYDFFLCGEDYYMTIEFVRGQSLESMIRADGCLEAQLASRIMSQTLDALAHAHSMGVLHRDIKPANILVTGDGRVKVTDFGIARVLGSSRMTRHGRIIGTLEYIAPERIRGDESDLRSDLYSAGVVLYEMLTGSLPFTGQTDFELIKAHLEQSPPALQRARGVPSPVEWDSIVHKALAKSPGQRYQSAEEFRLALPSVAMAAQVGGGFATSTIALRPPTFAPSPSTQFVPSPQPRLEAASEQASETLQPEAPSGLLATKRIVPSPALILGASGVLAVALAFGIALHFRSVNASKKEAPSGSSSPVVTTPGASVNPESLGLSVSPSKNIPSSDPLRQKLIPVPINRSKPDPKHPPKPNNGCRDAAIRALDGNAPTANSENCKHAEAIKKLNE